MFQVNGTDMQPAKLPRGNAAKGRGEARHPGTCLRPRCLYHRDVRKRHRTVQHGTLSAATTHFNLSCPVIVGKGVRLPARSTFLVSPSRAITLIKSPSRMQSSSSDSSVSYCAISTSFPRNGRAADAHSCRTCRFKTSPLDGALSRLGGEYGDSRKTKRQFLAGASGEGALP